VQDTNNEYLNVRLNKLAQIKAQGHEIYPSAYKKTHYAKNIIAKYQHLEASTHTEDEVRVAGRIMAMRNNGMFIDLHDETGKIQIFSHKNNLSQPQLELLLNLDLGDIIGVKGKIRCTPRGELTVDAYEITFLCKALLTLPEKYHGLHDVETRYRQRYVDLIVNEKSREILRARSQIITSLRAYLASDNFLEVETPMLHPIAGGAIAKPFLTYHNSLDMQLYLRIAPELYLKKLIVGGLAEKIFEINRCFRNEGISTRHNPEFTSVEIYQAYVDFRAMITLTEKIVQYIVKNLHQTLQINFNDALIDFSTWECKSMAQLVLEHTGVDFILLQSDAEAKLAAKTLNVKVANNFGWGKILEAVFAEKVEPHLLQPIHITYLPTEISPLAKVCAHDARLTERFESYVNGWEIANGFSELNDPIEQLKRFEAQASLKDQGDEEAHALDQDFITSLEYGMPPTGGLGIGIDRLVMLLTNSLSIREVIAFPTLRSKH
jgi:lysyl-tRNA synthetase, class II